MANEDLKVKVPEVQEVCTIDIDDIFVQLHQKAIEQLKGSSCTIRNSAIEGDGKNVEFSGPGKHLIAVIPASKDKDAKISQEEGLKALQTYVQWFAGPDVSGKITAKDLLPIEGEEDDSAKKDKKSTTKNESFVPSFLDYLLLEDGEEAGSDSGSEDTNKDGGTASDSSGDASEESKNTGTDDKDASTATNKEPPKASDDNNGKAAGWYIAYEIEVADQTKKSWSSVFDKFTKSLLSTFKNFGVRITGFRTGGETTLTVGDVAAKLEGIFGGIDPNEMQQNFSKELKQKFPQTTTSTEVFDKPTILKHLKKRLEGQDRAKVNKADLSLCVKVARNDKSRKLINVKVIADLLTKSIKGIWKTFKNAVDPKDIVLVNGYDENDKSKDKAAKNLANNTNDESMDAASGSLVVEDGEETSSEADSKDAAKSTRKSVEEQISEGQKYFEQQAASVKGKFDSIEVIDQKPEVRQSEDIVEKVIKPQTGVIDEKAFNTIKNHKYAWLLTLQQKTEVSKEDTREDASASILPIKGHILLEELLSSDLADEKLKSALEKLFENCANNKSLLDGAGASSPDKIDVYMFKATAQQSESMRTADSLYGLLFEDVISEAGHKEVDQKKLQKMKQLIKSKLAAIKKKWPTKEEFLKNVYQDQGYQLEWTKGKEAENNGTNKFVDLLYSDKDAESIAKEVGPLTKNQNFRNDLVYRFIAPVSKLEDATDGGEGEGDGSDENGKATIRFYDTDPEKNEKVGEPIKTVEVDKGTQLGDIDAVAELNKKFDEEKKDGFIRKGWNLDGSTKVENDIDVFPKYIKDGDEDKEFTIIFQYAPDPEDPDNVEEVPGDKGTQKIKAGESAEAPEPPEIDGWKFKKWSDTFNNVTEDKMILAEYGKEGRLVFKAPKDPENPDELESLGDPAEYEDGKAPDPPTPPEFEGWKFEKWEPDPNTLSEEPEGDKDIVATYIKEDSDKGDGEGSTETWFYIMPDYAGVFDEQQQVTLTISVPEKDQPEDKFDITKIAEPIELKVPQGEPLEVDKETGAIQSNGETLYTPPDFKEQGYPFEKWDPDISNGIDKDTNAEAVYKDNKRDDGESKKSGGYDFYIVPMKGLKYKDDDDGKK